jgi:3-oxoacyl-[acyl-carrier protein] reductase
MTNTEGRVVVITGGSRGLGAGIVQAYLDAGYRVATCARTRTEQVDSWLSDGDTADRLLFCETDVSDRADDAAFIKAVVERWGRVDILVNNAGVARDGVIATAREADVDTVIDLNLKGTLEITRLVTRRMLSQGGGYIVSISSIVGLSGYRGLTVYSATKAALDGLTRALSRELGSRNIFVNSVAPGYLRTEMSHGLDEEQLEQIVRRTPAGRLGDPEDIARLVMFLTSEDNTYITGQTFVADGGLTA